MIATADLSEGWTLNPLITAATTCHDLRALGADVARAGQILSSAGNLSPLAGAAAFAIGFGSLCYASTPRQFDRINGVLLGLAATAFVVRARATGYMLALACAPATLQTGLGTGRGAGPSTRPSWL
jgi:hypothetical protein